MPKHYARFFPQSVLPLFGNVYIAVGALLPGIGGTFTRFGYTEVLYVTELIGLVCIFIGYYYNVRTRPLINSAVVQKPGEVLPSS